MRPTWDEYFMLQAKVAALRSTCLSRPIGCVLVKDNNALATGYNGAVNGQEHCTDLGYCQRRALGLSDGQKDRGCVAAHAEANAIAQAAKRGIAVDGATAYCTLYPCPVCLKLLFQAGVDRIVYEMTYDDEPVGGLIPSLYLGEVSAECKINGLPTSDRRLPRTL